MIRRIIRDIVIVVLIVFVAYILVSNIAFFQGSGGLSKKTIIDTDSGNDIDDLFAVARAITDPDIEIIGLISSQWNFNENAPDSSVQVSQEVNEKILKILNLTNISHPAGANESVRFQDKPVPRPSEGAKFIIDNAHGLPSGEKLKVITLGATTNLASAILMDSSIIPMLDCYIVGLKYDPIKRAWNKNESNTRNDLNAMDIILNTKNLDLTVMPITLLENLKFSKTETFDRLSNKGNIWKMLLESWDEKYPEYQERIMGDVAIIEAIIHPKFATVRELYTPPENTHRKIKVCIKIKSEAMIKDYWKAVEEHSGN
jgi:inosine-uridine nucleoside N-ribohydrolase